MKTPTIQRYSHLKESSSQAAVPDCAGQDVQHKVRASVPAGEDIHIKTQCNHHQAGLREEV